MPQDDTQTFFRIGLDDDTTARLLELSEAANCEPAKLVAALVKDVLIDDAAMHGDRTARSDITCRAH